MANVENQLQKTSLRELEKHQGGAEEKLVLPLLKLPKTQTEGMPRGKNTTVMALPLFLYLQAKDSKMILLRFAYNVVEYNTELLKMNLL